MKKAQIFTYDLMFSVIIFIAVIFVFFHVWDQTFVSIETWDNIAEMKGVAYHASNSLFMSKGSPLGWNETSVKLLGIVSEPNKIDPSKYSMFQNLNSTKIKELLNAEDFNMTFILEDLSGNELARHGDALLTANNIIFIDNFVAIDTNVRNFKVVVWKEN